MLIRNAEANRTVRDAAPDLAYCPVCMKEVRFPRIQLPDHNVGQNAYHLECAAKIAASISKDLEKLLKSVIV